MIRVVYAKLGERYFSKLLLLSQLRTEATAFFIDHFSGILAIRLHKGTSADTQVCQIRFIVVLGHFRHMKSPAVILRVEPFLHSLT